MTTLASGPASFSTAASTLFDPLAEVPPDTHGSGWVHDIYATELLRDRRAVPEIENTVLSVISEHIRESAGGDLGRFQLDDPAGGLRVWRLSPAPAGGARRVSTVWSVSVEPCKLPPCSLVPVSSCDV